MSKSSFNPQVEDPVPSYEESIGSSTATSWAAATLHQQLDDTRLTRVRDILTTYVEPLLAVQGASGIYKTIFLLVPSNVDSLQQNHVSSSDYSSSYSQPKEPEVVGFPATDVVKLIRLKGEEHTVEFWRQPAIMEELASSLRMRLKTSGHRVEEQSMIEPNATQVSQSESNRVRVNEKKSGWFKSKARKPEKPKSLWTTTAPSEATIIDQKLGWRATHEGLSVTNSIDKPLSRGTVRVLVEWKEICLRSENAVGLYETQKGPGICLSVEGVA
ncbi:hypothetical protein TSTA_090860 [Talaromyces stipitatus ATCC 10500]|uniref:Uncharacterized protein n=1 Tax=Talaromyces stipitatus (strain ATCC 10500 / CBS 375.48 / QM 6759 / NRRL 1006) TaxID=441959 RepID=B8M1F0_TALSN|nr:uncharacterized protein TSTA_090860 [Talaromyces stipitatus ATCC 10500]EED21846.1 hypothetical protein TSTA_090860 [Talaromyces stipitatus ATCC 10500]